MKETSYRDYLQLNQELDRLYHHAAMDLGLSDSVLALLYTLWEAGDGLTPTQLYAQWSLSKQTGHSALLFLERRGLIRLLPGRDDRRSKTVSLTVRGQEYARQVIAPLAQGEQAAFSTLTPAEQQTLISLTGKLLHQLKEELGAAVHPKQISSL